MGTFNIQPFGVQYNMSIGAPEESAKTKISELELLSNKEVLADSKTFRNWTFQPWEIKSANNITLATFSSLVVTFVKGIDPDTGIEVVFATIAFRQTSNGYRTERNGLTMRVLALNQQEGVLEDWQVSGSHGVLCVDNGIIISYKQRFRPDWFNILQKAVVILNPSIWYSC